MVLLQYKGLYCSISFYKPSWQLVFVAALRLILGVRYVWNEIMSYVFCCCAEGQIHADTKLYVCSYNKNQLVALIFKIYFWTKTLHVSVPLSIIRSFSLCMQQWYMSHSLAVSKPVWHVEFYSKNKFEKLVYLVGFIIGICKQDARSSERQNVCTYVC